jgi:phage repressor protein C with HTH and peptisase S24 domain
MEPEIHEGDIVGVVRVDSLNEISPGSIYLIISNDSRMIKQCYPDNENVGVMWCVSPNYPSFPINKCDITALYRVVNRIVTYY